MALPVEIIAHLASHASSCPALATTVPAQVPTHRHQGPWDADLAHS